MGVKTTKANKREQTIGRVKDILLAYEADAERYQREQDDVMIIEFSDTALSSLQQKQSDIRLEPLIEEMLQAQLTQGLKTPKEDTESKQAPITPKDDKDAVTVADLSSEVEKGTQVPEVNIIYRAIVYLDNQICKILDPLDKQAEDFKKNLPAIAEAAENMKKMGFRILRKAIYKQLPAALSQVDLDDIKDACVKMVETASATIKSVKTNMRFVAMLEFDHWLETHLKKQAVLTDEIERYQSLIEEQQLTKIIIEKNIINQFEDMIRDEASNQKKTFDTLTLIQYRKLLEEKFSQDTRFFQLSPDEQKKLLFELELNHLQRLRNEYQRDIEARLQVEMKKKNAPEKQKVKSILANHYQEYDPEKTKQKLYAIVDQPNPSIADETRNQAIKKKLFSQHTIKKRKLIGRAFTLVAMGFALAAVIASAAVAPPLVVALLGVGVVTGLILGKTINPDDSIDNIAKKGFRYFVDKIHGPHSVKEKMHLKHKLSSADQQAETKTNINRNKVKRIFAQYKEMAKKDDIDEATKDDAKKLEEIDGPAAGEHVLKSLKHTDTKLITDTTKIRHTNQKQTKPLIKAIRAIESTATKVDKFATEIRDHLPMSELQTTVKDFVGLATKSAQSAGQGTSGGMGGFNLNKLRKEAQRVLLLSAYVLSSSIKSIRSEHMLNVEYWIKHRLLDRFNMQEEIKKLNDFCQAKLNEIPHSTISDDKVKAQFDALFSTFINENERAFYQLSKAKFRETLEEALAGDDKFLALPEQEQVYMIARLEKMHMTNKLQQCETDILVRANVEMGKPEHEAKREKFAEHIEHTYLAYEQNKENSFKQKLLSSVRKPHISPESKISYPERNDKIVDELKNNLKTKRKKVISRAFLLIFAGLTLASTIAGIAAAGPIAVGALLAGALAAAIIAKAVNKDESLKDIVNKGFKNISHKVYKQFTLWGSKEKMGHNEITPEPSSPKFSLY